MNSSFLTYADALMEEYRAIDRSAHREVIKFYEKYKGSFGDLDTAAYLEIELGYCDALFELGRYESFLAVVQYMLESVIFHNIKYLNDEDVFEKLLVRKAAAHFHLEEYRTSQGVLWQVVRMNPHNHTAVYLLKRCLIKSQPTYLNHLRGLSIFLFLLSALVTAVELLAVRPFFEEYASMAETSRLLIFLLAILLLVGSDFLHRMRSFHLVNNELQKLRSK